MSFDFLDEKIFLTIVHLFGVAFGAGGAFASDFMFFSSVRDERISTTELRFLRLGSTMVWIGLTILVLSGVGLFLTNPQQYLHSTKFLAKMTIVAIIIGNGLLFHHSHIPHIARHEGHHFPSSDEFVRKTPLLLMSGAISGVSWSCALVLGALKTIPFSYPEILGGYVLLLIGAIATTLIFREHFLPTRARAQRGNR